MPAGTPTPDAIGLRPATRADAADLARLVDLASEGLTSYLWARMAEPGESVWDVGARRAARDEGAFSWRNAVIAEIDGQVAGGLVIYRIADAPEPLEGLPGMFRPLQELENRALGTQYVNVLATYPAFRRRGVATALLHEAERRAGDGTLSLIVADRNAAARRLYLAFGFADVARAPIVKEEWETESDEFVLMLKPAG
jgi:ribosomal protein S18 acetylase RimI-like enzyme